MESIITHMYKMGHCHLTVTNTESVLGPPVTRLVLLVVLEEKLGTSRVVNPPNVVPNQTSYVNMDEKKEH